jgi:hypothetical protein
LKGGNGMISKYEINDKISNYIEELAKSATVASFYPNAIRKSLDVPLTPVLEKLNKLVDDDILELQFEIRCNEGAHIIDIVHDCSKYLGKKQYCMFCDEDIYVDLSNVSPIYYIKSDYREYLKKKRKKSDGRS